VKRMQERISLLAVLWVSVGIILFAVLWALIHGNADHGMSIAGFGGLMFVVAGAMFGSEVTLAIRAMNSRVDDRVRHGVYQDTRIAAIERFLRKEENIFPVVRIPGPDPVQSREHVDG
jgi:hypothetical protein